MKRNGFDEVMIVNPSENHGGRTMRFHDAQQPDMGYYGELPQDYGYYAEDPYLSQGYGYGQVDPYGYYAQPPEMYGWGEPEMYG